MLLLLLSFLCIVPAFAMQEQCGETQHPSEVKISHPLKKYQDQTIIIDLKRDSLPILIKKAHQQKLREENAYNTVTSMKKALCALPVLQEHTARKNIYYELCLTSLYAACIDDAVDNSETRELLREMLNEVSPQETPKQERYSSLFIDDNTAISEDSVASEDNAETFLESTYEELPHDLTSKAEYPLDTYKDEDILLDIDRDDIPDFQRQLTLVGILGYEVVAQLANIQNALLSLQVYQEQCNEPYKVDFTLFYAACIRDAMENRQTRKLVEEMVAKFPPLDSKSEDSDDTDDL